MSNFDLRKYLSEGRLYENALAQKLRDEAKQPDSKVGAAIFNKYAEKVEKANKEDYVKLLKGMESELIAKHPDTFSGEDDIPGSFLSNEGKLNEAINLTSLLDKYDLDMGWYKKHLIGVDELTPEEEADLEYVESRIKAHLQTQGKLNEAMSPQDVVDIADTVAEEFTIESAEEGDFMVYSVGEMDVDNMFFELDTDVTSQTPERILKMSNLGVGEGWGGSFRINPKEEGYEVRNSEKGGLVAIIDGMGNFKMISADESRAEMGRAKGEETDYMQRRKETDDYMQEGEDEVKEIKPNKMKKSELKEMIRAAFLNEVEEKEDMNEADNHPSEVFTDVELDMASEMLMDMFDKLGLENNVEKSDALVKYINAWFETNDFVNEEEEVEVDTEVEDEAGDEIDVDASAEEEVGVEMDQEAGEGLSGDKKSVQDSLEAALQGARALGDEKLADQIGNSITFFTRTHVVGQDQVAEAEIGLEEVYADKEEMFQIHTTDSPDGKGKWSPWAGQFFPNARSADEWMKKMEDGGYKFGLKKVPVPPKEVKEAEGDKYFQIHVANQKGEYKPLQGHVFPNPESADEFIKKIKAKGSFKDGIKKLPATPEDLKVAETQLNESVNRMKKLAGLIK